MDVPVKTERSKLISFFLLFVIFSINENNSAQVEILYFTLTPVLRALSPLIISNPKCPRAFWKTRPLRNQSERAKYLCHIIKTFNARMGPAGQLMIFFMYFLVQSSAAMFWSAFSVLSKFDLLISTFFSSLVLEIFPHKNLPSPSPPLLTYTPTPILHETARTIVLTMPECLFSGAGANTRVFVQSVSTVTRQYH